MAVEVAYKYASSSDTNELYLEQIEDGEAYYAEVRAAVEVNEEGLAVALGFRTSSFVLYFVFRCKFKTQLRAPVLHLDTKCSR